MRLPALVLLPGMDGSGTLFADFIAALGDEVAATVVSYPADRPLDYAGLAEFARTRLPAAEPFVLLGESFSGPVAIALAASRPPNLAGLILSCTFARNPAPVLRRCKALLPFVPLPARLIGLLSPLMFGHYGTPSLRRALRAAVAPVAPAVLRARLDAVLGVDHSTMMGSLDVPVLYLQAGQDRVVSRESARHIASLLPAAIVWRLPGPHLLLQAEPAAAATAVRDFLAGLPGQAAR